MNNLIEGLIAAGHNVKVLSLNTSKYHIDINDIPDTYKEKTKIEFVDIDLSVKPVRAFANLFSTKSYHVERFISKSFDARLAEILKSGDFDIVQIELVYMSPYIPTIRKYSKAKIVLRAHNIEHLIWERLADTEGNPFKRFYLRHLATTLKRYEYGIAGSYDGIVPITNKDAEFFRKVTDRPVTPVSFGIDTSAFIGSDETEPENALFHIGAMNWMPNEEGIRWFLENVWPRASAENPGMKLYLAGREMPGWLKNYKAENVVVAGEVPDAFEFISSKTISLAPLLSGSGIRIKIIESMAMGKAVVSTSIGAEGINYKHGENIMIADSQEEFVKAVSKLYRDRKFCAGIGKNAKALIIKEHDTKKIIHRLVSFYREIL